MGKKRVEKRLCCDCSGRFYDRAFLSGSIEAGNVVDHPNCRKCRTVVAMAERAAARLEREAARQREQALPRAKQERVVPVKLLEACQACAANDKWIVAMLWGGACPVCGRTNEHSKALLASRRRRRA